MLDLATGTGLVALDAAHRVGPEGSVLGVDLTTAMHVKARPLVDIKPSSLQLSEWSLCCAEFHFLFSLSSRLEALPGQAVNLGAIRILSQQGSLTRS